MVQNSPRLALDLDIIHHILPAERRGLPLDDPVLDLVGARLRLSVLALDGRVGTGSR